MMKLNFQESPFYNQNHSSIIFTKHIDALGGKMDIRFLRLQEDIVFIHDWVSQDYAKYWQMQGFSLEKVREVYETISTAPFSKVFIGIYNNKPVFLLEYYKAIEDSISKFYEADPNDYGFHILIAPANQPIPYFTSYIFSCIMDFMFRESYVKRVIVEPDVRNDKIHRLNKLAGFEYQKIIELPHKTAHLAFCTKKQFEASTLYTMGKEYSEEKLNPID